MSKENTKAFVRSHETRNKLEKLMTERYRPDYEPHINVDPKTYSPYGHELHSMNVRDLHALIITMTCLMEHQHNKFNRYRNEVLGMEEEFIRKWVDPE